MGFVTATLPTAAILRRLATFWRPHLGLLVLALACMLILAGATSAYAYLLGPALHFLMTGGREGLGKIAKFAPQLAQADRVALLWTLPVIAVVIGIAKGLAYLGQFYWMGLFGQRVAMDLRRAYFARIISLSPAGLSRFSSGDLLSRFGSDAYAVEVAATYAIGSYARDGLQILALVIVAVALDWRIALGAMLIIPVAALPVSRLTRRFVNRVRHAQRKLGKLAGQFNEGLGGIKTIQAFGGQSAELARFAARSREQQDAVIEAAWAKGAIPAVMEVLAATGLAIALAIFAQARGFDPENVVSLLAIMVFIYQPIKDLGRVGQFMFQAAVGAERIFEVLDLEPVPAGSTLNGTSTLEKGIRFQSVSFTYDSRVVLDGLSFEIPVGQVTALVGTSGSGKSTIVSLLLGFLEPASGELWFDEVNVRTLSPDARRSQFALVTQEPLLFSTTVFENITLGASAGPAEVENAARVANAHEFIAQLPQGYQTLIGERGVILSGGQKQRLCLARAVLRKAPVLILDEATSSLDPQSEQEVQMALARVLPGRTALVISHRLASVAGAHRICVLDQGKIVEAGSHQELLGTRGLYAHLWTLQAA